jgi:formate dehydrogenase (coenzyme F420) beta subunit
MMDYSNKIKEIAKKLLEEKAVDIVIGFKKGTLPMMTNPILIHEPEKTDDLHWDSFCNMNLANYLPKRSEKIGIFAKGCDSRNIVNHIVENQIKREQLHIIGIPCEGMLNKRKIRALLGEKELKEVSESETSVTLKGDGFEDTIEKKDYLQDNCKTCLHRNPVIYDELLGDLLEENQGPDPYNDVEQIEKIGPGERWDFFQGVIKNCIRCYACRNACPLCYCPTCFVDESDPQWVGKSDDPVDTMTFHLLRAYHCAGRCTDCGSCEQACPMDINVRLFTRKLNKDALKLYDWEAGLKLDERPPLDTYRPDDYDEFIR